ARGTGVASFTQAQARRQPAQESRTTSRRRDTRSAAHRATGDPPGGEQSAVRHISDILALFN
ncbi:hypothetical protein TP49_23270, partial (plasmid) [Xanthomonas citri pv. aurantifolii]